MCGEMKEVSAQRVGNVLLKTLLPEILETSQQGGMGTGMGFVHCLLGLGN